MGKGGTETENEGIRFNASRNAPLLFVDGVKMRVNTLPPLNAITSVWTARGGVPADFGDTDSGLIVIETGHSHRYW